MAALKDFNQAKSDLTIALLESANGISSVSAEQQLSSTVDDTRNSVVVDAGNVADEKRF